MFKLDDRKLIFLPAIISFLIALILVYKFSFPISWDVYFHIHMADLYLNNGLVFWDYSTVPPYGRLIMYPPLFHLVLGFISQLTGMDLINLTRCLQPFFAFYLIFVITYCGYKLSDVKTGFLTGLFAMGCFITFNRSVICTPATIAIGLSMLSCVFFYLGSNNNNKTDIIISALCLALISNLHMATLLLTIGVLGLYSLILLLGRILNFKHAIMFILIFILVGLPWWLYVDITYGFVFNSQGATPLFITNFIYKYYGIIPFVFTIVGYYMLYKDKTERTLFLFVWTLSLVLLSQTTFIGINSVSIRILEVAGYPLILVAGIGFTTIYDYFRKYSKLLLVLLVIFATLSSIAYTDSYTPDVLEPDDCKDTLLSNQAHLVIDPVGTILKPSVISSRFGNSQLARDRYDVLNYFRNNGDGSLVVCEDAIMDTIIVSTSNMSVVYGGFTESIPDYVVDPVHIVQNHSTASEIHDLNMGYILLNKNTPTPTYADVVYSNDNYNICKIKSSYR